ncbi:MAG: GntR family transcriptional regulator [Bacilli bacterium]
MDIILTQGSSLPLYEQIVSAIREQVLAGKVSPGEPLPSMRVLAKELQVSIITTKRAYEELEKQGIIATVAGKGSFIAEQTKDRLEEVVRLAIEEQMLEAITRAKSLNMTKKETLQLFEEMWEVEG